MRKIHIEKDPIWNGRNGNEAFGIGHYVKDDIEVTCEHYSYPDTYFMSWEDLQKYKIVKFEKGCPVRVVPIRKFTITKKGVVNETKAKVSKPINTPKQTRQLSFFHSEKPWEVPTMRQP